MQEDGHRTGIGAFASVAELAYAPDLGSGTSRCRGSIPLARTLEYLWPNSFPGSIPGRAPMKDEQVLAWILALGGERLLAWIKNPTGNLYLYGPQGTGKTLFQRAWMRSGKQFSVTTGNGYQRGSLCIKTGACSTADASITNQRVIAWLKAQ